MSLGRYRKLDRLTREMTRLEGRRRAAPAGRARGKLAARLGTVARERQAEAQRLVSGGVTPAEIGARLDRTDPYRHGQ